MNANVDVEIGEMRKILVFVGIVVSLSAPAYATIFDCSLNNVEFTSVNSDQASQLENAGAMCEEKQGLLNISFHSLSDGFIGCALEYEFDNSSEINIVSGFFRVSTFDKNDHMVNSQTVPLSSLRPGNSIRDRAVIAIDVECSEIVRLDSRWADNVRTPDGRLRDSAMENLNAQTVVFSSMPNISVTSETLTVLSQ